MLYGEFIMHSVLVLGLKAVSKASIWQTTTDKLYNNYCDGDDDDGNDDDS